MGNVLRFLEACIQKIYAQYVTEIGQGSGSSSLGGRKVNCGITKATRGLID